MEDPADLVAMYVAGRSIPDLADVTGKSRSTIRNLLLGAGVLRSRADGVRLARHKLGGGFRGKRRVFTPEHCRNISKGKLEHGATHAKGRSLKANGYIQITRGPDKHRGEHVVIMEARIGRRLREDEAVHHIDGNRSNNAENNLALVTTSGHARLHRREQRIAREGRIK